MANKSFLESIQKTQKVSGKEPTAKKPYHESSGGTIFTKDEEVPSINFEELKKIADESDDFGAQGTSAPIDLTKSVGLMMENVEDLEEVIVEEITEPISKDENNILPTPEPEILEEKRNCFEDLKIGDVEIEESEFNDFIVEAENQEQRRRGRPKTIIEEPEFEIEEIKPEPIISKQTVEETIIKTVSSSNLSINIMSHVCKNLITNLLKDFSSSIYTKEYTEKLFKAYLEDINNGSNSALFKQLIEEVIKSDIKDSYLGELTSDVLKYIKGEN